MAIYAGPWSIKDWNGTLAEVFHHCPRFICLHRPLVNLSREYNYLSRHASCCDEELFYRNSDVHVSSSVHLSVGKINQVKKKKKKKYACVAWLSLRVLDHRVPSSFDTSDMSVLAPPVHRGMTTLNREAFKKSFETLGVRLPAKKVGAAMKILSK